MNPASSSQDVASHRQDASDDGRRESSGGDTSPGGRRRSLSGSILSRLSFLRASSDGDQSPVDTSSGNLEVSREDVAESPKKPSRAMAAVVQQQKTRRRKGSLRKAALLGRGAQREQKDSKVSAIDTNQSLGLGNDGFSDSSPTETLQTAGFGLGISDATPRPSMDGYASRLNNTLLPPIRTLPMGTEDHLISPPTSLATSPTLTYTSTTDEDDILGIPSHTILPRGGPIMSSGSDSYFPQTGGIPRRRSSKKPKSPLAVSGLTATAMPVPDGDWDYSETEWWGWVVLIVTWIVFVTGMGSCLGVWSWAWDVGETPYAPPELEDDPTLPVTGYYPALIILTAVMAWVWVVVAWVGMKYFRHAKISGD